MQAIGTSSFPGIGQPVSHEEMISARLAVYDEPEAWAAFSQSVEKTSQAQVFQSFFVVKGMRCAACALTLEAALGHVKGVLAVQVSCTDQAVQLVGCWVGARLPVASC